MSAEIVLLWLSTAGARAAAEPQLHAWAVARGVTLTEPAAGSPPEPQRGSAGVAQRVERLLDDARLAVGALDVDRAARRLEEVERLLRKHASLPQSAWLMAERHHLEAARLEAAGGSQRARQQLELRAAVLEGTRADAYRAPPAEAAPAEAAPAPSTAPPAPKPLAVRFTGAAPGDRVYLDGRAREARTGDLRVKLPAGEHHVRVVRRGRAVWAAWVTVPNDGGTVRLELPPEPACTRADLRGVRARGGNVTIPDGVRCPRWAVARSAPGGAIAIATCTRSHCGPLLDWHRSISEPAFAEPQHAGSSEATPWVTYAMLGVGAVVATSVVLWQSGAFDDPERGDTEWRFDGPAALRF